MPSHARVESAPPYFNHINVYTSSSGGCYLPKWAFQSLTAKHPGHQPPGLLSKYKEIITYQCFSSLWSCSTWAALKLAIEWRECRGNTWGGWWFNQKSFHTLVEFTNWWFCQKVELPVLYFSLCTCAFMALCLIGTHYQIRWPNPDMCAELGSLLSQ